MRGKPGNYSQVGGWRSARLDMGAAKKRTAGIFMRRRSDGGGETFATEKLSALA
jgi:hypothetical protein